MKLNNIPEDVRTVQSEHLDIKDHNVWQLHESVWQLLKGIRMRKIATETAIFVALEELKNARDVEQLEKLIKGLVAISVMKSYDPYYLLLNSNGLQPKEYMEARMKFLDQFKSVMDHEKYMSLFRIYQEAYSMVEPANDSGRLTDFSWLCHEFSTLATEIISDVEDVEVLVV